MINFVINTPTDRKDIIPLVAGGQKCPSSHSYGPFIRDHYIIHFCLGGCGILKNSEGEQRISAGELFIIRPGEVATYTADASTPWHYVWLSFIGDQAGMFSDIGAVRTSPREITDRLTELVESGERSADIYTALLYELIYRLGSSTPVPEDIISNVYKYIKYNYMEDINASSVSAVFGFERSYLYRMFKKRYDISIKEFIIRTRMQRAKELLADGYSVNATAYMVGYRDEFNFSKSFKKYFGIPPKEARKAQIDNISLQKVQ